MKIQVDVIQGRGSPYEFGYKQGQKLKEMPLYAAHVKRRSKSIRSYNTVLHEAKRWFMELAPELWEEMEGLSEGLGWSLEDTLHEYGGYQQDWKKSGCSTFMVDGIYGRNYDYHPKTYDGRFVFWQPEQTKGYSSIGFAQRMIGRMDGMNEKGLAVGYHFVNRIRPGEGFICTTIARFLLNQCATVEEAKDMIKEIPHRHAFNYSLADADKNTAVVEASSKGVAFQPEGRVGCTNHFSIKREENRHRTEESESRLRSLNTLAQGKPAAKQLFYYLNHEKYNIAKREYANWSGTIHTAVYDTVNQAVHIGVGVNGEPVTVSFSGWLKGRDSMLKKMNGTLPGAPPVFHLERK
ncbi:acyl-CoA--6-aminopenicillanic acid acyl-transferase [Bacillus sp. H-16]|uniref:C45 family autoproteolytic acyltransferase/hydolase n=1 Tax=Alteribacter salitolerans TaxID=2912333 RepID=UPI001964F2EF|nr:C45 family peptidase [Alteribacter salitolerans]MBM7094491.1 acyl-CoA--6-aminopenicillanic acid acyl-transferase [Alteribacter salitolerans]